MIVSIYDIMNFQNFELGIGFASSVSPKTVRTITNEMRLPFITKFTTVATTTSC